MTAKELKKFIKDNLVIEASSSERYSTSNNMDVELRFIDDEDAFTYCTIYIPEEQ